MIKCIHCRTQNIIKEADELFYGIPLCDFHHQELIKKEETCMICKKIYRKYDDNGMLRDGQFFGGHNQCYYDMSEGKIDINGNPKRKQNEL